MLSVVMSSEGAEGSLRYRAKPCLRVRDDRDHGFQMIVIIHSRAA
jgi:hypothetical protein